MGWQRLLEVNRSLEKEINQKVTSHNRGTMIEKMEELLEERGELLRTLSSPETDEEKAVLNEVREKDLAMQRRLEFLFNELKAEMRNNKKQKKGKQGYTNPYASVATMDGTYVDSKK
ncbi:hypothetical protein [Salimicrobium halophilum]|uniref:Flagellar protein FliT n=1 Tax=Salimicrobium halophilum TaxID=86666 RepID=A0A1G8V380_9BACI|nr:hypothetical protein [Salimicrobium halophilum]SDJ60491.1 flagellar protein FliT [Salimicrobium halophilum]